MFKRKYRYIVLGFITIVIFSLINISLIKFNLLYQLNKNRIVIVKKELVATEENQINKSNDLNQKNIISEKQSQNSNWKIKIPIINLEAEICQGTTEQVLQKYVGHFENTSILDGNIGLAAHNNTFFKNLKNVKIGDKVIYISELGQKEYKVTLIEKISETDWSKLKQTQQNKITLITCVKNMPQLRLCVQATEV